MENVEYSSRGYTPDAGRRSLKTELPRAKENVTLPFSSNNNEKIRNVGKGERLTSLAAGSILTMFGLSRRNIPGLAVAAAGTAIAARGVTGHCAIYETLGIDTARKRSRRADEYPVDVAESFTINASPEELYSFWRTLEQLPRVFTHLESVTEIDSRRSHWVAKPIESLDRTIEWDAEITRDEPNKVIAWKSVPSSSMIFETEGEVQFVPALGDRGTTLRVLMQYRLLGGGATRFVSKMFGKSPQRLIREDLRNFKRMIEIGERITTEGQSRGTCVGKAIRNG